MAGRQNAFNDDLRFAFAYPELSMERGYAEWSARNRRQEVAFEARRQFVPYLGNPEGHGFGGPDREWPFSNAHALADQAHRRAIRAATLSNNFSRNWRLAASRALIRVEARLMFERHQAEAESMLARHRDYMHDVTHIPARNLQLEDE